MYVFGFVRLGQRDKSKGNMEGVVCPAGCIDNGGRVVPGFMFLIGVIKKINDICTKRNSITLIESYL